MPFCKNGDMRACSSSAEKPVSNTHCCPHDGSVFPESVRGGVGVPPGGGEWPAVSVKVQAKQLSIWGNMSHGKKKVRVSVPSILPQTPTTLLPSLEGRWTEHGGCHEWSVSPVDGERRMPVLTGAKPEWKKYPTASR